MHIALNKVLTGIVVQQMSDVILIHYLQIRLFTEWVTKEWFVGRLYILYTVIFELTLVAHVTHSHIHSKQSTMHKPTPHFAQKYSVLPLLFFIIHTWQRQSFPF